MIQSYYDIYILLFNFSFGVIVSLMFYLIFSFYYNNKDIYKYSIDIFIIMYSFLISKLYINLLDKLLIDFKFIHLISTPLSFYIVYKLFKNLSIKLGLEFYEFINNIIKLIIIISKPTLLIFLIRIIILKINKIKHKRIKTSYKELF